MRLTFCGNQKKSIAAISEGIGVDNETAKDILEICLEILDDPDGQEYVYSKEMPGSSIGLGFHVPKTKYYISVKHFTLQILALILDNKIGGAGITSFMLSSRDVLKRWLWTIENKHYCVLNEIILGNKSNVPQTKEVIIAKMASWRECCNLSDVWSCPYLVDGYQCTAEEVEINNVIDELIDVGIIEVHINVLKQVF